MKLIAITLGEQIVNYYRNRNRPRFSVTRFCHRNQYQRSLYHRWSHADAFRWNYWLARHAKFGTKYLDCCTSPDFDDLSAPFLTILRDRELIGGISHLVQFFHVELSDGKRVFLCGENITLLHENIIWRIDIPRYIAIDLSKIAAIHTRFIKIPNSIQI